MRYSLRRYILPS